MSPCSWFEKFLNIHSIVREHKNYKLTSCLLNCVKAWFERPKKICQPAVGHATTSICLYFFLVMATGSLNKTGSMRRLDFISGINPYQSANVFKHVWKNIKYKHVQPWEYFWNLYWIETRTHSDGVSYVCCTYPELFKCPTNLTLSEVVWALPLDAALFVNGRRWINHAVLVGFALSDFNRRVLSDITDKEVHQDILAVVELVHCLAKLRAQVMCKHKHIISEKLDKTGIKSFSHCNCCN